MRLITNIRVRTKGFLNTMIRFPLTILLLTAAVIMNAIRINTNVTDIYMELMITTVFGASLSIVLQLIYERFFSNYMIRIISAGITIIAAVVYYLLIHAAGDNIEIMVRTGIIFFVLLISFLWIPVFKNSYDFNQSFMAAFKGFFITAFFTGILYLGILIILATTNTLIIKIGGNLYEHMANIIFLLLAPIYFLSLIPVYSQKMYQINASSGKEEGVTIPEEGAAVQDNLVLKELTDQEEMIHKTTSPTRFLETLISYIVIPITVVFTIILLLYIIINITGKFWTNNLMEPILISYSITVIIIYLLASRMSNAFVKYFRRIFPKILVPVVLFQTVSSIIRSVNDGLTYGRYYIILFGTFAIITGILFCFLPLRKNGLIAPILIIMALISIVPPVDAFTISRFSQVKRLENTLTGNKMLEGKMITPKVNIPKRDQEIIISCVGYLDRMNYTKDISWLSGYYKTNNFEKSFGFTQFAVDKNTYKSVYISRDESKPIPISGYDYLLHVNFNSDVNDKHSYGFDIDGSSCQIGIEYNTEDMPVIILTKDSQEVLRFEAGDIFDRFIDSSESVVDTEEVTFTKEGMLAAITVIAQSISINEWDNGVNRYADAYIMINIK